MNNDWELTIKKVNNGYIIEPHEITEEILGKFVFEIQDNELGDLIAMQEVLNSVKEYLGILYSKHNKSNLVIDIEDNQSKIK